MMESDFSRFVIRSVGKYFFEICNGRARDARVEFFLEFLVETLDNSTEFNDLKLFSLKTL